VPVARTRVRCAGGDGYLSPLEVRVGEVPADLHSRLAAKSPQRGERLKRRNPRNLSIPGA